MNGDRARVNGAIFVHFYAIIIKINRHTTQHRRTTQKFGDTGKKQCTLNYYFKNVNIILAPAFGNLTPNLFLFFQSSSSGTRIDKEMHTKKQNGRESNQAREIN